MDADTHSRTAGEDDPMVHQQDPRDAPRAENNPADEYHGFADAIDPALIDPALIGPLAVSDGAGTQQPAQHYAAGPVQPPPSSSQPILYQEQVEEVPANNDETISTYMYPSPPRPISGFPIEALSTYSAPTPIHPPAHTAFTSHYQADNAYGAPPAYPPAQVESNTPVTTADTIDMNPHLPVVENNDGDLLAWCKNMGYVPADMTLPPPPRGRPSMLEPFLHLPPVRVLSRATNFQRRRSMVRGEKTVPEWRAANSKGGGTANWYALFCQLTGVVAPTPCERCAKGSNMWSECVIAPNAETDMALRGACASCAMNNKRSLCSSIRPQDANAGAPSVVSSAATPVQSLQPLPPAPAPRPSTAAPSLRPLLPASRDLTTEEELAQLFDELAENERVVAEALERRRQIDSQMLACEKKLDDEKKLNAERDQKRGSS
ncbi:hypothetical protein CONLIGDRAFT_707530 [Coniochaeta ligniaria NRRL 30616]|uniref:Uncharacterized protein n=1 Tax=Coniochaeta ligniaria NRRL 30616 TaxID=1408157 RepID=A0A1J7J0R6_9PEZI|nr:hypothetical protein CONLIGDRAFT_707530 [Coniochaeta ligniaria NRRL 30616]